MITVANSSHARVFSNAVTVTGPGHGAGGAQGPPGRARRRAHAADRLDDLGRVRRRGGRHRRQRGRGVHRLPGGLAHRQDRARRARHLHVRHQEGQRHGGRCRRRDRPQQRPGRTDLDGRHHRPGDPGRHGHPRGRTRARHVGEREPDRHGQHRGSARAAHLGLAGRGRGLEQPRPGADDGDQARHRRSGLERPLVGRERHDRRGRSGRALRAGQRHVDGDAAHHRARRADEGEAPDVDAGTGEERAAEHRQHLDVARPRGQHPRAREAPRRRSRQRGSAGRPAADVRSAERLVRARARRRDGSRHDHGDRHA